MSVAALKPKAKPDRRRYGYYSLLQQRLVRPQHLDNVKAQEILGNTETTMTERITRENKGHPIEAVLLAKQEGFAAGSKRKQGKRITYLHDAKTKTPLLMGAMEVMTKELRKYQGVIERIRAGKEPFGKIIREAAEQAATKPEVKVMNFIRVDASDIKLKQYLKKMFRANSTLASIFGLDDSETTIYGRHAWLKIGGQVVCKVVEFISPKLL